jgi:hypothetical protein
MTMLISPVVIYGSGYSPPDDVFQLYPSFPDQRAMEFHHLQHFKRLIKAQMPDLAFRLSGDGDNPPDFMIYRESEGKPFGLELTTFGIPTQDRQTRTWHFARLQERLLAVYKCGGLKGLSGLKFDVSFGSLGGTPPKDLEEKTFNELVSALDGTAKLPRPAMDLHSTDWHSGSVGQGEVFWSLAGVSDGPFDGSVLAKQTGFEVECTMREWKTDAEAIAQMGKTIADKDDPRNTELLIVAGGPTRSGRALPAGAVIAKRVADIWQGPTQKPTYLRRVFLDIWGLEKIVILYES